VVGACIRPLTSSFSFDLHSFATPSLVINSRPPVMRLSFAVLTAALQAAVCTASTLTPPVLPLIVRNPYLSTWLGNARDAPWSKWPMFYTGEEVGLSVMAHVPSTGTVYPLLGKPHESLSSDSEYVFSFGEMIPFPILSNTNPVHRKWHTRFT
jgi:hypothetical protein